MPVSHLTVVSPATFQAPTKVRKGRKSKSSEAAKLARRRARTLRWMGYTGESLMNDVCR